MVALQALKHPMADGDSAQLLNAGDLSDASDSGSVGWYRRDFTLPAGAFPEYVPKEQRQWLIQFESVNYRATVWLNGHKLGRHSGAYLPFEFTMRHLRAGVNQLVVRVDNRRRPTDFPPPSEGGWWNYGGILDAVYMRPVAGSEVDNLRIRDQASVHHLQGADPGAGDRAQPDP